MTLQKAGGRARASLPRGDERRLVRREQPDAAHRPGAATAVETLEIDWPASRTRQVFTGVPVNSFIEIREFDDTFRVVQRPRMRLAGPSSETPIMHVGQGFSPARTRCSVPRCRASFAGLKP